MKRYSTNFLYRYWPIFCVFALAIVWRLWFISLAPQPFRGDQTEYDTYAVKIYNHPFLLASHSYRTYVYPLFVAFVYTVAGLGNYYAVFIIQAVIDASIGVAVYWLLKNTTNSRRTALFGFVLYVFNPFTTGYVGVMLSEVLTAFLFVLTLATGYCVVRKPGWGWGVVFGICCGLTASIRNATFVWLAIPIGLVFWKIGWRHHTTTIFSVFFGVLVTFAYPTFVNLRDFGELNITTVDSFYAKEFYQGALIAFPRPEPLNKSGWPIESQEMWLEYYSENDPGRTTDERRAMAIKYYRKAWDLILENPQKYIALRFQKMWYVWQKENIFVYEEPGFSKHKAITYYGNIVLLALSAIGFFYQRTGGYSRGAQWIWFTSIGTLLYTTVAFSFTHAEYRLTIPFYPLIIYGAAIGYTFCFDRVVAIVRKIHS